MCVRVWGYWVVDKDTVADTDEYEDERRPVSAAVHLSGNYR